MVETHLDGSALKRPAMIFYPGRELGGDPTNWWGPNQACVEALLRHVGFKRVDFTSHPLPELAAVRGIFHAWKTDAIYEAHKHGEVSTGSAPIGAKTKI
ncbi:MAG: hypothetical protein JO356_21055 [Acidobacteria bacterium]|nr:hypothetical protein [Acidobacteriota bacterium]